MMFEEIYRRNLWNGVESLSGPGSGTPATRLVAAELAALVDSLGIESVLDYGCGDGFWMPELPGYVGYDPTGLAIDRAKTNHRARAYTDKLPGGAFDLVIVRDVVQHLSFNKGLWVVGRASSRVGKFLMMSHFANGNNRNIADGDHYSPDMTAEPFSMPEPDRLIFDGYHYHDPGNDDVRDPGKYLALWDLRRGA